MKRALLSVSDKTGIVDLGKSLVERGWELLSAWDTNGLLVPEPKSSVGSEKEIW